MEWFKDKCNNSPQQTFTTSKTAVQLVDVCCLTQKTVNVDSYVLFLLPWKWFAKDTAVYPTSIPI